LNDRIKDIQEKIHRFAERDISQKQTELLTMALKKVKERLQEVTQGNL
jgi:predicted ribosome quality control (RQC) complex YloA/Tae2 family protein